jgi:glucan phosphorylase
MSTHARVRNPISPFFPTDVEGFASLPEPALDLCWTWHHGTDVIWQQLDPTLWTRTHNPWVVLQMVARDQFAGMLAAPAFRTHVEPLVQAKRQAAEAPAWLHLALFPYNDPGQLPIIPIRAANGEWLRLEALLLGVSVWLRTWQVPVGRTTLYLLDSNDAANFPAHRGITSELYGGGPERRLPLGSLDVGIHDAP